MELISDLQIHSRFARACSRYITLDNLEKYARIKGLHLLGTADFQHPEWNKEIKSNLKEDENGILWSKTKFPFLWQTEVSLMYSQDDKRRAVHLLIFSPNTSIADNIIEYLSSKGRLDYDGRPIFGISCRDLVKDLKQIDDKIEIIPAHCMTPYFGLYGSKSGFDSLKDCFKDQVSKIHAIESGMSADPQMLWRFKEDVNIVSFSDMHSFWPWRIGRESTIFDVSELTYDNIINAIRTSKGLNATIETSPFYGKYHWDGHRNCNFSCSPQESKKLKGICPKCGNSLTIGVDYRVEEIAKESKDYKPKNAKPFYTLIPLQELIAVVYDIKQLQSKKVWESYNKLIKEFKNEFNVLLNVSFEDLKKVVHEKLANLIIKNRENKLNIKCGFDGVYGKVILNKNEKIINQKKLGDF